MHILDPKHALDPPAQFWPFNPIAQTSGRAHSRPTSEKMPRLPVKDIQHPETSWQVGFVGVILHPDWTSHFTGGIQNGSWRPWSYFWVWTRHEKTKSTVSVSQLNLRDCWMIGGFRTQLLQRRTLLCLEKDAIETMGRQPNNPQRLQRLSGLTVAPIFDRWCL